VATVALVSVASAAAYAALRIPMAASAHRGFADLCARLEMQPQDWPCRITSGDAMVTVLGGSLFIWLGLALAMALVAWSGRRVAWLVPIVPALLFPLGMSAVLSWWDGSSRPSAMVPLLGQAEPWSFGGPSTFWDLHWDLAASVDLVLVCLPALAVVLFLRPSRLERRPPVWAFRTALWTGVGAATVVTWAAHRSSLLIGGVEDTIVPAVTIALVGVLAGHRRGWVPWLLVPLAVLLSGGPTSWVHGSLSHFIYLGRFGGVVPLAAVGFIGFLVVPFAWWLASRREATAAAARTPRPGVGRVRPAAVALGVSMALLGTSAIMRANDPLPVQVATILPTYLGVRESVEAGGDFPHERMCEDVGDESLTICRSVEKLLRERA
jgi:hypothetical protein